MSPKLKFGLIILIGVGVSTVAAVELLGLASTYPGNDTMYYLFGGLGILAILIGIAVVIFWTSRIDDQ
jgi:hypothetical protein